MKVRELVWVGFGFLMRGVFPSSKLRGASILEASISFFGDPSASPMRSRRGLLPLCVSMFVIAIFVRHIPIGQNKDTRWEPFPLSSLFRVADFEIDVIAIFQLLIKGPLK